MRTGGSGRSRALDAYVSAVARLSGAANFLAKALVFLMVLLFAYEVFLRTALNRSTGYADQLSAYALAAITFLSLAHTLRIGGHVRVNLVLSSLRPAWRRRLAFIADLLALATMLVFVWSAVGAVIRSYEDAERSMIGLWFFPTYVPQLLMPVGLTLLALQAIAGLLRRESSEDEA